MRRKLVGVEQKEKKREGVMNEESGRDDEGEKDKECIE